MTHFPQIPCKRLQPVPLVSSESAQKNQNSIHQLIAPRVPRSLSPPEFAFHVPRSVPVYVGALLNCFLPANIPHHHTFTVAAAGSSLPMNPNPFIAANFLFSFIDCAWRRPTISEITRRQLERGEIYFLMAEN